MRRTGMRCRGIIVAAVLLASAAASAQTFPQPSDPNNVDDPNLPWVPLTKDAASPDVTCGTVSDQAADIQGNGKTDKDFIDPRPVQWFSDGDYLYVRFRLLGSP